MSNDPLPPGALLRLGTARLRHTAGVTAVDFSADGARIVSGDACGVVICWDATDGRELWRARAHGGQVRTVQCDPARRIVVTIGEDRVLAARDLSDGTSRWSVERSDRSGWFARQPIAFTPDGSRLAWGGLDERVHVVRPEDGSEEAAFDTAGATALAFSADGGTLFAGTHSTEITLLDRASGRSKGTLVAEGPRGSGFEVTHLALSRDGDRLVAGYQDGTVRIWDPVAATLVETWPGETFVSFVGDGFSLGGVSVLAVAFPPGADAPLAAFTTGTVTDFTIRRRIRAGEPPIGDMGSASWRYEGGLAEAAAFDPRTGRVGLGLRSGRVAVFGVHGHGQIPDEGHDGPVTAIAHSPDGRLVATGGRDGCVRTWDAATGAWEGTWSPREGPIYAVAFSRDSSEIVAGGWGRVVHRHSLDPNREQPPEDARAGVITGLAFGADGTLHVTESEWWEGPGISEHPLPGTDLDVAVTSFALSWDGAAIWIGRSDGTVLAFPAGKPPTGPLPR